MKRWIQAIAQWWRTNRAPTLVEVEWDTRVLESALAEVVGAGLLPSKRIPPLDILRDVYPHRVYGKAFEAHFGREDGWSRARQQIVQQLHEVLGGRRAG